MNLKQEQYKLQEDSIKRLEEKLKELLSKKNYKEDTFTKKYLRPISKEINIIRKENLPNVFGDIFKNKEYSQEIFELIKEHKEMFNTFTALEKNIEKGKIADYLLEDIAQVVANKLIELINNETLFYKENIFYKELIAILVQNLEDMDKTIKKYKLRQKQSLALFTLLLTDMQIALVGFKSIMKLLMKQQGDEDDKVKPNTEQSIIKEIGENIFYEVSQKLNKEYLIVLQEMSNEHLLEFASELFIFFEAFEVIEKDTDTEQESHLDLYQVAQKFQKDSKTIYANIVKYASPFFEPMVVPPLPWSSIDDGGYLQGEDVSPRFQLYIQKTTTRKDRKRLEAIRETFSPKLLEVVNIIQATSWRVNKKMLQAVSYLEKEYKQKQIQLQERTKETQTQRKNLNTQIKKLEEDIDDISIYYSGKKETIKELFEDSVEQKKHIDKYIEQQKEQTKELWKKLYSLREQKVALTKDLKDKTQKLHVQNTLLILATKYAKYETIYFTWQVDFRGRIYPVQALLNPQGDSLAKSLLEFATKKKVDEQGLKWLQIHGANNYGIDKVSFTKRIEWVQEHTQNIQNIAQSKQPFDEKWLQEADKPFEFLAFCYEYDAYLQDPADFESSLPIAVDGSNNGFQHIAALLRDTEGAKKVNVLPNDTDEPADIYKEVALQTKILLENANIQDFQNELKQIMPYIDRSFVKKGVMTDSYGAGKKTKAIQLEEKLKKLQIRQEDIKPITLVIATYLDKAIDTVAPSSAIYKNWINSVGKQISKLPQEIVWHTPFINFEVRQYEYKTTKKRIVTSFQGYTNTIQIREETDEIDSKQQSKGIAPNFIHSLDATHMYMTILSCKEKGLKSFATVHDSFATHASDVETLVITLKEEFIKLTEYDVLKHFQNETIQRYEFKIATQQTNNNKKMIKEITKKYVDIDFDIQGIKDSSYFFS